MSICVYVFLSVEKKTCTDFLRVKFQELFVYFSFFIYLLFFLVGEGGNRHKRILCLFFMYYYKLTSNMAFNMYYPIYNTQKNLVYFSPSNESANSENAIYSSQSADLSLLYNQIINQFIPLCILTFISLVNNFQFLKF